MRNQTLYILTFSLLGMLFLASCGTKESGQLIGVQERPTWNGINPYGMVYVPSGRLHIGQSDEDIFNTFNARPKSVSISGFYMDDTEISNNEYRQFVYWVRDSIAHVYMDDFIEDEYGNQRIDWTFELDYNDELLADMYLAPDQTLYGKKELNTAILDYEWKWVDWQKAAHDRDASIEDVLNTEVVNIYPDTMCWIRDFKYSYNEPMTRNYFSHPAFDDYPVVGITWKQAKAFSYWRTRMWTTKRQDEPNSEDFRLPNEYEWEYAARAGRDMSPYPWGGPYIRNSKGCLLANFKPGRGNYAEDGGQTTVDVYAYYPNDYGLYNMAGNVAEWTETAYFDNANYHVHDLNPDMKYDAKDSEPKAMKRKVVRGGSWKDIGFYLQNGSRNWEYQDTSKSYIGFRNVLTFLGRSANDY
jgi:gliding motility-associated lipoprotein GldK